MTNKEITSSKRSLGYYGLPASINDDPRIIRRNLINKLAKHFYNNPDTPIQNDINREQFKTNVEAAIDYPELTQLIAEEFYKKSKYNLINALLDQKIETAKSFLNPNNNPSKDLKDFAEGKICAFEEVKRLLDKHEY